MAGGKFMAWLLALIGILAIIGIVALVRSTPYAQRQQIQNQQQPSNESNGTKPDTHQGEQQKANAGTGHQKNDRGYIGRFFEFVKIYDKEIVALGTVCIAAFTVILAFATGFLYFATRDLVHETEAHGIRSLRAYMGIHAMEVTVYPFEKGGFTYIAHAELRNYGQTPAYNLVVQANAVLDVPDAIPFSTMQGPAKSAGPSIAFRDVGSHIQQWQHISEDDKNALMARTKIVFFWGTVTYRDAFNKERKFIFRLISGSLVVGANGVYSMAAHPMGYEGD